MLVVASHSVKPLLHSLENEARILGLVSTRSVADGFWNIREKLMDPMAMHPLYYLLCHKDVSSGRRQCSGRTQCHAWYYCQYVRLLCDLGEQDRDAGRNSTFREDKSISIVDVNSETQEWERQTVTRPGSEINCPQAVPAAASPSPHGMGLAALCVGKK